MSLIHPDLRQYLDLLKTPTGLFILFLILFPLIFDLLKRRLLTPKSPPLARVPGCFRLGLPREQRSNLNPTTLGDGSVGGGRRAVGEESGVPRVKALFTYPVKSCRGVELAVSEVSGVGLGYDRLFCFAQLLPVKSAKISKGGGDGNEDGADEGESDGKRQWRFITQREFPNLALIETEVWAPHLRAKPPSAKNPANTTLGKTRKQRNAEKQRNRNSSTSGTKASAHSTASSESTETTWAEQGGVLSLTFPSSPRWNPLGLRTQKISIRLPLAPTEVYAKRQGYELEDLSIWIDVTKGLNITSSIPQEDLAKLKAFLGVEEPLALFRVDEGQRREIIRSLPKDRPSGKGKYEVGFADAFPIHLLSLASVRALEGEMPEISAVRNSKGGLDAGRFRANIYLEGCGAWEEDTWKRVTMGRCIASTSSSSAAGAEKQSTTPQHSQSGTTPPHANGDANSVSVSTAKAHPTASAPAQAIYHIAARCARCTLPNVSPSTGLRDSGHEPLKTLSRTRKVDRGAWPHPCLGMQVIPLFERGVVRVGDEVVVEEVGEHLYEKMLK